MRIIDLFHNVLDSTKPGSELEPEQFGRAFEDTYGKYQAIVKDFDARETFYTSLSETVYQAREAAFCAGFRAAVSLLADAQRAGK